MSFGPFLFLFFQSFILLFYLLVHQFDALLDQRLLEPLFEFHVADFLVLLLLESVSLVALQLHQVAVVDVHSFLVVPFKHLVASVLHSEGFFFLLLDEGLEEIALGLGDELLSKLGFVVLTSDPCFM